MLATQIATQIANDPTIQYLAEPGTKGARDWIGGNIIPLIVMAMAVVGGGAVLARNMSKLLLICAGAVIFFGLFALSGNENSGSLIGNWLLSSLGFK